MDTNKIITDWFEASFIGNAVSRDETVYNLVYAAVADLRKRLTSEPEVNENADEGTHSS